MNYNAYDELMSYFQFEFNLYIVLLLIIMVGTTKSIIAYRQVCKINANSKMPENSKIWDFLISLLAACGLASAMFFQGVISDISFESGYVWVDKSFYLFIAAIIFFSMQLLFLVLTDLKMNIYEKGGRLG